jgi:DNA-binding MarR family transcriptional regulator
MSDVPSINARAQKDIQRLLASAPAIAGACELDLLVFFYRHPRSLLTNEQVAVLVGYDTKQIARAIESFVEGGLLERTQDSMHAARLYVLLLEAPQDRGLKQLLALASTHQGRADILQALVPGRSGASPDPGQARRSLRFIA